MPGDPKSSDDVTVAATLASSLDSLDDAINYRNWIIELASPYLQGPILELGAGHGTFTEILVEAGNVHAVEPDPYAHEQLVERFGSDDRVTTFPAKVEDVEADPIFGTAVMINVLEHIPDHDKVLLEVRRRLQPGGHLVIFVPAFMVLFSRFDKMLGHVRRYRKPALKSLVASAGFEVAESRYVNMPGFFSWMILVRFLRRVPTGKWTVKIFDRVIVPIVRAIESRLRPPFGQSILLVARKP